LNPVSRIDYKMLLSDANSQLLELESIRNWQRNPDIYSSSISSDIFSLMKRSFAPADQRLKDVIAREKAVPALLSQARENLQDCPRIYTQIALEQLPGIVKFFRNAVPQAFADVKDAQLQQQFQQANGQTIAALQDYEKFLRDSVLPKSKAEFAIGEDNYRKKLLYEEMVDVPLPELLSRGYDELHRLQKEFVETAHAIDPSQDPARLYATISSRHPQPAQLLSSVTSVLSNLRDQSKAVVDLPSEDELKVQETPPFMRATTFASMDTPGPFERVAKEAYYQVTLPEANWDAKRTEEHMRFFCDLDLLNTSVHEAYPGHYVQALWIKNAPSKTRKLLGCGSNSEGWAHYCEELMADRQPDNKELKLVQLHDALLRACRYICGIQMHTQGMTVEQAKDFFIKEGFQEPANAEREAKRGTGDPTYLVYTLGKLEILRLRDDYQKAKGKDFSLKQFHDDFLAQGNPPIKLVREAILQKSQPN
jgi:uncharacterized protein (DUF885 family)